MISLFYVCVTQVLEVVREQLDNLVDQDLRDLLVLQESMAPQELEDNLDYVDRLGQGDRLEPAGN